MSEKYSLVTAICRFDFPSSITSKTSSGLETNRSVAPFTNGTRFLSSCTLRLTFDTGMRQMQLQYEDRQVQHVMKSKSHFLCNYKSEFPNSI